MVRLIYCLILSLLLSTAIDYAVAQEMADAAATKDADAAATKDAAAAEDGSAAKRAALEKRVNAKWKGMIDRDFAAVYSFTSPEYRKAFSLDIFKRQFGNGRVAWRRIEVLSVDFKGDDAATVGIRVYTVYHDPQLQKSLDMATVVHESWVRTDGQWWYLAKE